MLRNSKLFIPAKDRFGEVLETGHNDRENEYKSGGGISVGTLEAKKPRIISNSGNVKD